MRIYLDIDGVLADFVGAAARYMKFDPTLVTEWDFYSLIGTTDKDFWDCVKSHGQEFWSSMEAYPWCHSLFGDCNAVAPVTLLTAPPPRSDCRPSAIAGRVEWIHATFGESFRDYFAGCKKETVATPNSLLIDDNDSNCKKFEDAGGRCILFPRPWNANRGIDEPYSFVMEQLDYYRSVAA